LRNTSLLLGKIPFNLFPLSNEFNLLVYNMISTKDFEDRLSTISEIFDAHSISRDDVLELLLAMTVNKKYGVTPSRTHLKLVELFCRSSGLIQDVIHRFRHVPLRETLNSIVLQSEYLSISAMDFSNIMKDLKDTGYATLPVRLDKSTCKEILDYAQFQEYSCMARCDSQDIRYTASNFNDIQPYTLSASMEESCILRSILITKIINDPVILSLVSFYLRSNVSMRAVSFWHSFESADHQPRGELAQLFHYDLDEFRWLKLFIFLTDVTYKNGPHVFISGFSRPGYKASSLLSRGYARISDDDMEHYHPRSSWQYLTCPAGTLTLADTRCWHKGTALQSGVRSVLQPEYAPTTFSKNLI